MMLRKKDFEWELYSIISTWIRCEDLVEMTFPPFLQGYFYFIYFAVVLVFFLFMYVKTLQTVLKRETFF